VIISKGNVLEKEYSGKIPIIIIIIIIIIIFKKSSENENFLKTSQILPQLLTT
jgi:hypothetical protein